MKRLEVYFGPDIRKKEKRDQYTPIVDIHDQLKICFSSSIKDSIPSDNTADYSCFHIQDSDVRKLCKKINKLEGYCAKIIDF